MAKESYKFVIFGNEYSLVSDEEKARVERSALMVDSLMKELSVRSGLSDHKKIAVLAALQLASKVVDLEASLESIKEHELLLADKVDCTLVTHHTDSTNTL